jgi:hypothetical protein
MRVYGRDGGADAVRAAAHPGAHRRVAVSRDERLVANVVGASQLPFAIAGSIWLLAALDYNLSTAVWVGAAMCVRPLVMTVATTVLGLLPLLWESGVGADVSARYGCARGRRLVVVHVSHAFGSACGVHDLAA